MLARVATSGLFNLHGWVRFGKDLPTSELPILSGLRMVGVSWTQLHLALNLGYGHPTRGTE